MFLITGFGYQTKTADWFWRPDKTGLFWQDLKRLI